MMRWCTFAAAALALLALDACGDSSPPPTEMGCQSPSECPGSDTECSWRLCVERECAIAYAPIGEPVDEQTPSDCAEVVCDGVGGTMTIEDETDVIIDGNDCTADVCENGVPTNPFLPKSTTCDQNGGSICDGAGSCVGCKNDSECPGYATECGSHDCDTTTGKCAPFELQGTPSATQTEKDCRKRVCDGAGAVIEVSDNTDLPLDNNPCTNDLCTDGVPSNPALTGVVCNVNGGRVCNQSGACVECLEPAHCPGTETDCHTKVCHSNTNTCDWLDLAAGQPIANQIAGDCKRIECTAAHTTTTVNDDTDKPADEPNPCTAEVCNGGTPGHDTYPPAQHLCQGEHVCNAGGACVACSQPSDCPGVVTSCAGPTCSSGNCGYANVPNNTPLTSGQTPGDCRVIVCDGQGEERVDNANDPASDNKECTTDACSGTTTTHTPKTKGTPCTEGTNGHYCDGGESCVECLEDSHCSAEVCHNVNHSCGASACDDGIQNTNEQGIDCGGPCAACPPFILLLAGSGSADFMTGYFESGDTAWTTGTLAGRTDRQPALAVAANNKAVAVWKATGSCTSSAPYTCPALQYSTWNRTTWAIAQGVGSNQSRNRPQAVAAGGKVHLIFHGGNYKHYYAAYDTSWSPVAEVVSDGAAGTPVESYGPTPPTITVFDSRPMIAHVGDSEPHDVYDRIRSATGSTWSAPHAQGLTAGAWWDQNNPIPPAIVTLSSGNEAMIALVRKDGYNPGTGVKDKQVTISKGSGSSWTTPTDVSDAMAKQVALVALPAGQALLVFQGTNDQLYWSRYNGTAWSTVVPLLATNNPTVQSAPSLAPGIGTDLAELAYISKCESSTASCAYHARLRADGTWNDLKSVGQVATSAPAYITISSFTP